MVTAAAPPATPAHPPSIGGEVASALLWRLATSHGLRVADWAVEAAEMGELPVAPDILVAVRGSVRDIAAGLSLGGSAYVELDDDGDLPGGLLPLLAGPPCLHISLSTATCFSLDLAPLLCGAMVARGWLSADRRADAEICLHEAISNAIVHGNLDIHQGPSADAGAFDGFFRAVQVRLADRDHARRRVTVEAVAAADMLCITIRDEGRGHAGRAPTAVEQLEAKSGRGIRIMVELADRVTFTEGGRAAHLHFRR